MRKQADSFVSFPESAHNFLSLYLVYPAFLHYMGKKRARKISERELFGIPSRKEMERASIADTFLQVQTGFSMFGLFAYDLTDDDKRILKFLSMNPEATQTIIAESTGIKLQKVKSITSTLRNWGYLTRIGSSKQGVWKVLVDIE